MMREPSCSPTSHCTTRPETSKSSNLIKRSLPYSMVEKRCATSLSCLYHQYHQYYRSSHRSFLGFSQLRDVYACNNNEIHHIFSSREYLERSWPRASYDTQFTTVETCDGSFGRVVHGELQSSLSVRAHISEVLTLHMLGPILQVYSLPSGPVKIRFLGVII